MGIQDRDYYQSNSPSGIELGRNWSMVTKLIVANAAIYFIDLFVGGEQHWLLNGMTAGPESLHKPWMCWQLITYAFAHSPNGFQHVFWNMFALWMFGRDVESVYGSKEFLRIYLLSAFLGGLVFAVRGLVTVPPELWPRFTVLGASGAVTAVTLLFCIHFPKRTILLMFVLPVPAWVLGALVIAINVLGIARPDAAQPIAYDVHLVGAIFAAAYYKFHWRIGGWIPGARGIRIKTPTFRSQPKLKVHNPEDHYRELDAEGDRLLNKVAQEGIDSLTASERRKLEDYSRRMQQKHR